MAKNSGLNGTASVRLLGYEITTLSSSEIIQRACQSKSTVVVNTLNPHSYVVAKNDLQFSKALFDSDYLLPDGAGIVLGLLFRQKIKINRLTGPDFMISVLDFLDKISGSVLFIGSTETVLNKIKNKCNYQFPNVSAQFFSPPFKNDFTESDIRQIVDIIKECRPQVVFFGMTAPKQEKVIDRIKGRVDGCLLSGVGAAFDYYAGNVKRPSAFWANLNFEWLPRLMSDPRRLWRRTFVSAPIFVLDLLTWKESKL